MERGNLKEQISMHDSKADYTPFLCPVREGELILTKDGVAHAFYSRKTALAGVVALALCIFTEFLFPLGVSAKKTHYDANHVHWRNGENCAFSPTRAGDVLPWDGPSGAAEVVDIREIYDPKRNDIVIGVVYVTSQGKKIYQVNPLFPYEKRAHLDLLRYKIYPWAGAYEYDEKNVGFPERECQPNHLGNGIDRPFQLREEEYRIYSRGIDPVLQGKFSAKTLKTPFIDEEK